MNLLSFVELERLLLNGLPGLWSISTHIYAKALMSFVQLFYVNISSIAFLRAMGGSVPFEEALAARLSLFKPSLSKVEEYLEKRPPRYCFCLQLLPLDSLC